MPDTTRRPTEGYGKVIEATDLRQLDANGVPGLSTDVGDFQAQALRVGGPYLRGIFLLLWYLAMGGQATGVSPLEFLSAAGFELDGALANLDSNPANFLGPN